MFHLILTIGIVIASIRWGEWNKWRKFLPTMYFVMLFNMLYQYISASEIVLWEVGQPFVSQFITDMIHGFILLPCLTLMFLSNFPTSNIKKVLKYVQYFVVSMIIETIAVKTDNFHFRDGWNLWWEIAFYPAMYISMRVHHKSPRNALIYAFIIIVILLITFRVDVI